MRKWAAPASGTPRTASILLGCKADQDDYPVDDECSHLAAWRKAIGAEAIRSGVLSGIVRTGEPADVSIQLAVTQHESSGLALATSFLFAFSLGLFPAILPVEWTMEASFVDDRGVSLGRVVKRGRAKTLFAVWSFLLAPVAWTSTVEEQTIADLGTACLKEGLEKGFLSRRVGDVPQ